MNRRRLFIIGAGASYACGVPDAGTILPQLWGYVSSKVFDLPIRNKPPVEERSLLAQALNEFLFLGRKPGEYTRFPLDHLSELVQRRAQEVPKVGMPVALMFYETVSEYLYARSVTAGAHEAYRRFAANLLPSDLVLTLNWDSCLEIALSLEERDFSLRLNQTPDTNSISVIKLHGSIDYWVVSKKVYGFAEGENTPRLPECLDSLALEPPSLWTDEGMLRYELVRLRTYDLGFWVNTRRETKYVNAQPVINLEVSLESEGWQFTPHDRDVGPFILRHCLAEYPSPFMLTPRSSPMLYDWHYGEVASALKAISSEIDTVYVIGYSFPDYDRPFFDFLESTLDRRTMKAVHIINPGLSDLSTETLTNLFGSYEGHSCGFQEFDWSSS